MLLICGNRPRLFITRMKYQVVYTKVFVHWFPVDSFRIGNRRGINQLASQLIPGEFMCTSVRRNTHKV